MLILQQVKLSNLTSGCWSDAQFAGGKLLLTSPRGISIFDLETREKVIGRLSSFTVIKAYSICLW